MKKLSLKIKLLHTSGFFLKKNTFMMTPEEKVQVNEHSWALNKKLNHTIVFEKCQ